MGWIGRVWEGEKEVEQNEKMGRGKRVLTEVGRGAAKTAGRRRRIVDEKCILVMYLDDLAC